jgi:hypothetical protein
MDNNALSSKGALMIATMLSTMMLAASLMASMVSTTAFAQEDASQEDSREVQIDEGGVGVDPIIQNNVQVDVKPNVDVAVVTDEEDCDEASNDVNQEILQSSDQQANRDVEVGEGGLYVSPIIQNSVQVGLNYNIDRDVILVEGCQPADHTTLSTSQSSDQNYNRDIEAGGGSNLVLPTDQSAHQIADNRATDEDIISPVPLPQ